MELPANYAISTLFTFLAELACVVIIMLIIFLSITIGQAVQIFMAFMIVGFVIQIVMTYLVHRGMEHPMEKQEITKKRGVFWKIYAWGMLAFLVAFCFIPDTYVVGWLLYIPLLIGCLLFAHNKWVCHPWLWKILFFLYIILFLAQFIMPFLNLMPGDAILICLVKGALNIIVFVSALCAAFQRGFNTELIKRSQLQPNQSS